jgi:hypothetical protein
VTLQRRKWLIVIEELAYRRIINCVNVLDLRNIGNTCIELGVNGRTKSVM